MIRHIILYLSLSIAGLVTAQTNLNFTNKGQEQILLGNYNPETYKLNYATSNHHEIICGLQKHISTDSLKSYLVKLGTFHNRHTYSDTTSNTTGIGAARRWTKNQFDLFGKAFNNRLITGYMQFDYPSGSCGDGFDFRNVMAVLPGIDTSNKEIVIIEAHLDSRCEDACDLNCLADGIEDNGSGVALVMELARTMVQYNFNHTILFMLTTGEEQGLYGAAAMAKYCSDKGLKIKAVLNNDVVGGIRCGETSSHPGCKGEGSIDSLQVRIFSNGGFTFPHRSLARTIKMFYDEKLKSNADVPMNIAVMEVEDRTGRGGDHIPFREKGYASIRFTAANEHGDAHPDDDYTDRQHSSRDILGIDTDGDGKIDDYYVDFNYLKRNAVINGMSATLLALGPQMPLFKVHDEATGLRVEILGNFANEYRIGVRTSTSNQDFDALYRTNQTTYVIPGLKAGTAYRISVAAIDQQGIMSAFTPELINVNDVDTKLASTDVLNYSVDCNSVGVPPLQLKGNEFKMLCYPNPSKGLVTVQIKTSTQMNSANSVLRVVDLQGREVQSIDFKLHPGMVEVNFELPLSAGQYLCSLLIEGEVKETKSILVK